MIGKKSELQGPISMVELLSILDERKKFGELTYEQQKAYEHAEKVVPDKAWCKKAREKLDELNLVSKKTAIKLAELRPKSVMLVKQILAPEGKTFEEEQVAKILAITSGK